MSLKKDFIVKEGIQIEGTSSSISTTTGALIVNGGFGLAGDAWFGGKFTRAGDFRATTFRGAAFSLSSATYTDATLKSTTSLAAISYFGAPKIDSTNSGVIVTNAANLYIENAPTAASGNLSFTNAWSAYINNGNVYIGSTNSSTNSISGNALQVAGGIGTTALYLNGEANFVGTFNLNGSDVMTRETIALGEQNFNAGVYLTTTTNSTNKDTGALVLMNGGLGVEGNINAGGYIKTVNTTDATNTYTGALIVSGGAGIGGNLYARNGIFVSGLSNISTVAGNSLQVTNSGGLGVSGTSRFEGQVFVSDATNATNTTDGALKVAGGIGSAGNSHFYNLRIRDTGSADVVSGALTVDGGALIKKNLFIASEITSSTSIGSNALYVAGGAGIEKDLLVAGSVVVKGSLTLLQTGTQLVVNSTQTYIVDPVIDIGGGTNRDPLAVSDLFDKGLLIHYNTGTTTADNNHAFFGFEHTGQKFILKKNVYPGPSNIFPVTDLKNTGSYATFDLGSINLYDTTDATTNTGALNVIGGVAVQKQLQVGDTLTANSNTVVSGILTVLNTSTSTSVSTGAIRVEGGVGIKGTLNVTTGSFVKLVTIGGVASTGTTNGDLVVQGGIGTDNIFTRAINVTSTLNAANTTTDFGALQVEGGIGVKKDIYAIGTVRGSQLQVNSNIITSGSVNTTTSVKAYLDQFQASLFTTAKYLIQVVDTGFNPNKFHVCEIVVVYDGSGGSGGLHISQYGILTGPSGELGTFDIEYSIGFAKLTFTPNYTPGTMKIQVYRTALTSGA